MTAHEYFQLLRRRWIAIVVLVVIGLAGGAYHASTVPKAYIATSRALVSFPPGQTISQSVQGQQLATTQMLTLSEVVTSANVAQKVITSLALPLTADALKAHVGAQSDKGTFVLDIQVTDGSPARAALIADNYVTALSDYENTVQADTANKITISSLDQAVVPTKQSEPKPITDALFGLFLGLLGGLIAAIVLEVLDRSIKTQQQGAVSFDAPLLGLVPRRRNGFPLISKLDPKSVEAEFFRTIRTAVNFLDPDQPLRSILITSPLEGEGKTTVAANLALTMAAGGFRVAVLDADLRRARLSSYMLKRQENGLSSVLVRIAPLSEAMVNHSVGLDILPAGSTPPNPAELLASHSMAQLLEHLADSYDLVIIDAPPVLSVTDAVALSAQVDGVIAVARFGKTRRSGAVETARRIDAVGGRLVGFVLNAVPAREVKTYGY